MDLIHEIDLFQWLIGNPVEVFGYLSNVSDQKIDAEDLANIIIKTESGAVGSIQMDLVSPALRRGIEIVLRDEILFWDYNLGKLESRKAEGTKIVESIANDFDRNTMFQDSITHFLQRIENPAILPSCSFVDGIKSIELVEAIEKSFSEKSTVKI